MADIKIGIVGCAGRMGAALLRELAQTSGAVKEYAGMQPSAVGGKTESPERPLDRAPPTDKAFPSSDFDPAVGVEEIPVVPPGLKP